ncbi:Aste57867_11709 [Aphanomyces stellatus]|uniref:Aste57867_11709 protein n=1 Tax=Aphanomyces stellatus TaxID=120398 RepID=A0A485KTQ1_9STRA|nr:hypothetical protein As57867_011666 [Aphanomyces stellatus]VFT88566.1 Aste57867_11709 [Aphanomyces stellatus]
MLEFENPLVLGWVLDGTQFVVRDEDQLRLRVLPRYFSAMSMVEFQRELERLGFDRGDDEGDGLTFKHPVWIRSVLHCIHRWNKSAAAAKSKDGPHDGAAQDQAQSATCVVFDQQQQRRFCWPSSPLFQQNQRRPVACVPTWSLLHRPAIVCM